MVSDVQYAQAVEAARDEMAKLLKKRATIDARLSKLRNSIGALSRLLEKTPGYDAGKQPSSGRPSAEYGITSAIRKLLLTYGPLSTIELRARLNEEGFNINSYASGLTLIHNTLRRLEQQKEIRIERTPNGTMAHPQPKEKATRNRTQPPQAANRGGQEAITAPSSRASL